MLEEFMLVLELPTEIIFGELPTGVYASFFNEIMFPSEVKGRGISYICS